MVAIRGDGVAARCCSHLLGVRVEGAARGRVPAIVVGAGTQGLVCDVFGRRDLFDGLPQIERRTVLWGPGGEALTLPHAGVVISEEELLGQLRVDDVGGGVDAEWTVFASRPLPEGVVLREFGTRRASAVAVELKNLGERGCWVESLESGWLFLIPGWLIAVGGEADSLLGKSRLVGEQVRAVKGEAVGFPAYPRIADPLCGAGWLSCGAAAMGFDPICGDGVGNAVREAILASAAIRAAMRGESAERLLAHYRARLMAGFRRHLDLTLGFYRAGNSGEWWEEEIHALVAGVEWCTRELGERLEFAYRLDGFELRASTE